MIIPLTPQTSIVLAIIIVTVIIRVIEIIANIIIEVIITIAIIEMFRIITIVIILTTFVHHQGHHHLFTPIISLHRFCTSDRRASKVANLQPIDSSLPH